MFINLKKKTSAISGMLRFDPNRIYSKIYFELRCPDGKPGVLREA